MKISMKVSLKRILVSGFLGILLAAAALAGDRNVILHFSDFGPPEAASGSATVMKILQEEQTAAGKRTYVVLPEYDTERFPSYKSPAYIIRVPRSGRFQKSAAYARLVEMMRSGEVETVHVHKEANFSRLGLSLAKKFGVPTVLTAHMMIGPFMKDHFANKPWILRPFFNWLARKIERDYMAFANGFDMVTAPTEIVRDYLVRAGVTRPITIVPPGGVPIERFTYTPAPDRAFMLSLVDVLSDKSNTLTGLAENRKSGLLVRETMGAERQDRPRKVVVMLARLSAEKGIESVLEAWHEVVKDRRFDYQFVLAGLGGVNADSERIYRALQSHSEAAKSIHYVGSLAYEDVPRLLSGADVIVSASHHETFGLALVEAGASGRPVIVPDLPAFRTFLKDGETGLFVPKVDGKTLPEALGRLFSDPETFARMSVAARKNAEQYSSVTVSRKTQAAYSMADRALEKRARLGRADDGRFFKTPLSPLELCRWIVINLLTKP